MINDLGIEIISTSEALGSNKPLIPPEVTQRAKEVAPAPPEVVTAKLISSRVDDFIRGQLAAGVVDEEAMALAFARERESGLASELSELNDEAVKVKLAAEKIGLALTEEQAMQIKESLIGFLKDWGVAEAVQQQVREIELEITDSGTSDADTYFGNGVRVSRTQAIRKAIDFVAVYGEEEYNLREVAEAIMSGVFAHEVGHRIDTLLGVVSNNASFEWGNQGDFEESRSERFAEGISRLVLAPRQNDIKSKEWGLHLAKTQALWEVVGQVQGKNPDFRVNRVFRRLRDAAGDNTPAAGMIEARQLLYVGHPVENYALAYDEDMLRSLVGEASATHGGDEALSDRGSL